jgi:hypothetical protein
MQHTPFIRARSTIRGANSRYYSIACVEACLTVRHLAVVRFATCLPTLPTMHTTMVQGICQANVEQKHLLYQKIYNRNLQANSGKRLTIFYFFIFIQLVRVTAYSIHHHASSYPEAHRTCLHHYRTARFVTCSTADDTGGGGAEKKRCTVRSCSDIYSCLEAEQRRSY